MKSVYSCKIQVRVWSAGQALRPGFGLDSDAISARLTRIVPEGGGGRLGRTIRGFDDL